MLSETQAKRISKERDDNTCCCCGKRGGKMTSHHIYSKSKYPHLHAEPDNMATMCIPCHRRFHDKFCHSINGVGLDKLVKYLWKYAKDKNVIKEIEERCENLEFLF